MIQRAGFAIGDMMVEPGSRTTVDLPISVLSNHTPVTLPVHVVHGKRPGPTLFVSAAVHGDEVIGVEIIRRLLKQPILARLRGTLMAIPVVNAYGLIGHTRYLPDRRDLNRSFPGSPFGSLAGRLAHLFMTEIVERSEFGIDLHSAAVNRVNLPQIRVSPTKPETMGLAHAFGAGVIIQAPLRPGSLRAAAQEKGIDVLLYEAGEGLRFDEVAIRAGTAGILRVMAELAMVAKRNVRNSRIKPIFCEKTRWMRAPEGGILRSFRDTGEVVAKGDVLGVVGDPFGDVETNVTADTLGLIIGKTNLPVVNQGDALFHLARLEGHHAVEKRIGQIEEELQADPLFDEDEII